MKRIFVVTMVLMLFGTAAMASSEEACPLCTAASNQNASWPSRSISQATQGFSNIILGWAEFFVDPIREVNNNPHPDVGYKLLNGVFQGWGKTLMVTGTGVLELATAWTPARIVPDSDCPGCRNMGFGDYDLLGGAGDTVAEMGKNIATDLGHLVSPPK